MILLQLKEDTKAYHNHLAWSLNLFHSVKTLTDYTILLQKFLGFYLPIETSIGAMQERDTLALDFERRKKTGLLLQDLSTLGIPQITLQTTPVCQNLPHLASVAHVWGCLYVLEGATLGGVLISRHMKKMFGLTADNGSAFFNTYGNDVGPMWQQFTTLLVEYASVHQEDQLIIHAANETFSTFSQWLLGRE